MTSPTRARRLHAVAALLAFTSWSCGGVLDGSRGPSRADLGNGSTVEFTRDGHFAVKNGGRTLFEVDAGHGVVGHTYDEDVTEIWGFYAFDQSGFVSTALDELASSTRDGNDLVLVFNSSSHDGEATIRISGESASSTTLSIAVTGIAGLDAIELPTRCDASSTYLGFGEQYNATNQRGEAFPLWVQEQGIGRQDLFLANGNAHTSYFPMPYFMDARGFGVVVDTHARVVVDLCQTDPSVASLRVEHPETVEIVLLHGPTPKAVVTQLGDRYGRPTAPVAWTYSPWIGIQGGQARVLQEADDLDAAGVPWSALWAQDWVGFLDLGADFKDIQYHWNVDTSLYPDLAGLTAALHARDKRFLGYANPFVEQAREHFAPLDQAGALIRDTTGASLVFESFKGNTSLPDLTNPAANAYVGGFLNAMFETYGMDGYMADFGEWLPINAVLSNGVSARLEHNLYPQRWQELNHSVARAARGNDYAIFSRSGWLGSQGTSQIVWIGDQEADFLPFDGLPTVIPALLNLGLSGVPYVTHDIAGYSGGPRTKQLWLRWTELGAFTPIMRTHEGLKSALNWRWNSDAETSAHFAHFARIHMALVPTFMALADEAATTSIPPLRHLLLEFPTDPNVVDIADQFMLGPDLLVAPVVTDGATSREVYFPAGTWFHALRANESYTGPGRFTVSAPIGEPPVFSRGAERTDLRAIP